MTIANQAGAAFRAALNVALDGKPDTGGPGAFTTLSASGQLSTALGYQFRGADATTYELLRYTGGTNNPGLFVKVNEATKLVELYQSGSAGGESLLIGGIVTISPTGLAVTGQASPSAHNTYDLGTTGVRWKDLWLQSGAFNGSDARLKTAIAPLTTNEINAAKQLSKEIGTYQWLESVQKKGDAARHHVGFTVQRAIEILQLNGCDPFSYGFIGYDKWDDVFVEHAEILPVAAKDAVLDTDGNIVEPAIEAIVGKAAWIEHKTVAGDAYSFRYDQLNMFIAAGLEARLAALEAK